MSLTRIDSGSGASVPEALDATKVATEPAINSRLEIIYPLSIRWRVDTKPPTLEQEWHETPRPLHILPVGLPESRREGSFLNGYAIGIGEPQAEKTGGKARPISE